MTAATPDPRLPDFLRSHGLAKPGDDVTWTPLIGGVSSDIWRVDLPDRSLCIKRALPELKVAARWRAPTERNAYEWAWINFASEHCPTAVPEPVASDSAKRHWDNNFNLLMATVESEDFPTCEGMQRGFLSDAQDSIVFGRNEPALQHFHRGVAAALAETPQQMAAE